MAHIAACALGSELVGKCIPHCTHISLSLAKAPTVHDFPPTRAPIRMRTSHRKLVRVKRRALAFTQGSAPGRGRFREWAAFHGGQLPLSIEFYCAAARNIVHIDCICLGCGALEEWIGKKIGMGLFLKGV